MKRRKQDTTPRTPESTPHDTIKIIFDESPASHRELLQAVRGAVTPLKDATLTEHVGDGIGGFSLRHTKPSRIEPETLDLMKRCAALKEPHRYRSIVEAHFSDLDPRVARQRFASIKSKYRKEWNSFIKS
jgi:hypothetical protein